MLDFKKAALSADEASYRQKMGSIIKDFKNRCGDWFINEESQVIAFKALDSFIFPGLIRFEIGDVQNMLVDKNGEELFLGYGMAGGEAANKKAVQSAVRNALTYQELSTCTKLIFNVLGNENLALDQIIAMSRYMMEYAAEGTEIVFGANIDYSLGDELSVFIIAK